jgi:hypothetical protein
MTGGEGIGENSGGDGRTGGLRGLKPGVIKF